MATTTAGQTGPLANMPMESSLDNASRGTDLKENDRLYQPKLVLRLISLVFSLAAIALLAASYGKAVSSSDVDGYETNIDDTFFYYSPIDTQFGLYTIIPLGIAIIWAIVSITLMFVRRRPVHPGFHVGFDLVLWIALIVLGAITIIFYVEDLPSRDGIGDPVPCTEYYSDGSCADPINGVSPADLPQATAIANATQTIAALGVAGGAFTIFVGVIHFVLFVWACVDTQRYNNSVLDSRRTAEITSRIMADLRARGQLVEPSNSSSALERQPFLHPSNNQGPATSYYQPQYPSQPSGPAPNMSQANYSSYQPYAPQTRDFGDFMSANDSSVRTGSRNGKERATDSNGATNPPQLPEVSTVSSPIDENGASAPSASIAHAV